MKRKPALALVLFSLLAVSLVGCGKSATTSPLAPTTAMAAATTSATISGSVSGGGSGLASTTSGGPSAGLTVSVTGTSVSSVVDAAGRFQLTGVPAGPIELHFTGPGVDAKVQIGTVNAGDTIVVNVTVSGTAAEIDDSSQSHDNDSEIEGRVDAVPPLTPAGAFSVTGKTITTAATTTFTVDGHAGTFADVKVGVRVHVKAATSGTSIVATSVNIQNTQTALPTEVHGLISGLAGTAASFQFDIGSRHITGDAATHFDGHATFSSLVNGSRVEVKGTLQNGSIAATTIHVEAADNGGGNGGNGNDGDGNGGDHNNQAEASGTVSAAAGTCPAIQFMLGTTKVTTTASTEFDLACTSVINGAKVEVKGTRATDGSITATRVKKD